MWDGRGVVEEGDGCGVYEEEEDEEEEDDDDDDEDAELTSTVMFCFWNETGECARELFFDLLF